MFASAYRRLTADQLVNEGPCLITGWSINASADGGIVTIYDGLDTESGTVIEQVEGLASVNNHAEQHTPILCNNGLYIDIGANVTGFTVYYIPLRGNSPLRAYPGFMMTGGDNQDG